MITSAHHVEELRKRYFRYHVYSEIIRPNRFSQLHGQSFYHGETDMRGLPDGIGSMHYHSGTILEGEWLQGKIKKEYRRYFPFQNFNCKYTIYCKNNLHEYIKIIKIDNIGNIYIK